MERAWEGILRSQAVINSYVLKASVIEVIFKTSRLPNTRPLIFLA